MTYSQRLTHGNSSDIIYLEHQIGVAEDELAKATEEQQAYERDLNQLSEVQNRIETIRTRLKSLQDELGKLED
jgi:chromosome segregation ATPase